MKAQLLSVNGVGLATKVVKTIGKREIKQKEVFHLLF